MNLDHNLLPYWPPKRSKIPSFPNNSVCEHVNNVPITIQTRGKQAWFKRGARPKIHLSLFNTNSILFFSFSVQTEEKLLQRRWNKTSKNHCRNNLHKTPVHVYYQNILFYLWYLGLLTKTAPLDFTNNILENNFHSYDENFSLKSCFLLDFPSQMSCTAWHTGWQYGDVGLRNSHSSPTCVSAWRTCNGSKGSNDS